MKNIHVIPVDKEPVKGDLLLRHIWKGESNECISWWRYNDTTMYGDTLVYTTLNGSFMDVPSSFKVQNIYITSDEEIKEGDWGLSKLNEIILFGRSYNEKFYKKIILTTDQDLIADGVQSIDDEFLEWFFINPSCEEVKIEGHVYKGQNLTHYKIIIPKEEPKFTTGHQFLEKADKVIVIHRPKQETLEEAAEKRIPTSTKVWDLTETRRNDFSAGAKWQQEQDKNKYSEEEVIFFIKEAINYPSLNYNRVSVEDWFKQFKKE
jgi:hypothetical protein